MEAFVGSPEFYIDQIYLLGYLGRGTICGAFL